MRNSAGYSSGSQHENDDCKIKTGYRMVRMQKKRPQQSGGKRGGIYDEVTWELKTDEVGQDWTGIARHIGICASMQGRYRLNLDF